MTIEIRKPELEVLLMERMKTGAFQDIEDVIMQALEAVPVPEPSQKPPAERPLHSAAQIILDSMKDIPPEIMATMPTDGASQHDHYIYGWPKREV